MSNDDRPIYFVERYREMWQVRENHDEFASEAAAQEYAAKRNAELN